MPAGQGAHAQVGQIGAQPSSPQSSPSSQLSSQLTSIASDTPVACSSANASTRMRSQGTAPDYHVTPASGRADVQRVSCFTSRVFTSMTDQPDRLPALVEPTSRRTVRIFPHHPRWSGDPRKFEALYELVDEVCVPCAGPSPSKKLVGERSECAFCGRGEPATTFREIAHTIPAGFGNRHHFTREECDECNHAHEHLDDALANYLAIERVTVGVRSREGGPKLKGNDETFMRYSHERQRLEIVVDTARSDSSTRASILSPDEIEITAPRPGFAFDHVVRELARLSWMVLPRAHRARSLEHLAIVQDLAKPPKWELFRFFTPGAPRVVGLRVWRARDSAVPLTVLSFTVGPLSTVWASCDGQPLEHRPGPLPAFEADPRFGEPTMQFLELAPGTVAESTSQTIMLACPGMSTSPARDEAAPIRTKNPRPRLDVEFRWTAGGAKRALPARVHVQRPDGSRLLFGDGSLAAEILVDTRNAASAAACELELMLAHKPLANALATLDLLDALVSSPDGATIHASDGRIWQLGRLQPPPSVDLRAARTRLEELQSVARALQIDIAVPADDDRHSWLASGIVASALQSGGVAVVHRPTRRSFVLPEESIAAIADIGDEPGPLEVESGLTWSIGDRVLDVGNVKLVVPAARIASRTPVERDGKPMLSVEFVGDYCRYEFERWLESDSS